MNEEQAMDRWLALFERRRQGPGLQYRTAINARDDKKCAKCNWTRPQATQKRDLRLHMLTVKYTELARIEP